MRAKGDVDLYIQFSIWLLIKATTVAFCPRWLLLFLCFVLFSCLSDQMEHLGCSIPDAAQLCRYEIPGIVPVCIRWISGYCLIVEVCSIFDNSNRYFSTKKCNTKTHFRVDQVCLPLWGIHLHGRIFAFLDSFHRQNTATNPPWWDGSFRFFRYTSYVQLL